MLLSRLRAAGFGLRLVVSLTLTFAVIGVVQVVLASVQIERAALDRRVDVHAEDAQAVYAAHAAAEPGEQPLAEVHEVLRTLLMRPGTDHARLIAPDARVAADGARVSSYTSTAPASPLSRRILRDGGSAAEPTDEGERYEFAAAVELATGRHVLAVEQELAAVTRHGSYLRWQALELTLLGLIIGVPMFFLFGGRGLQRLHRQARDEALRDGLTGLANHRAFHEEIHRSARSVARSGEPLSLALVDVDEFKLTNDTYGHQCGDQILVRLAGVLRGARAEHRAFRVGGDEFALLLPRTSEPAAGQAAERVRVAAASAGVAVSVGVSSVGEGEADSAGLIEQADAALYEAKRRGRGRVVDYSSLAGAVPIATPAQVTAIRRLIAEGDLNVAFQPIHDLRRGAVLGHEALMRPAERYGFASPLQAFDVADRIGHAVELSELCRTAALQRARDLPDASLLFLNVHPRELELDATLGDRLLAAVRGVGRAPETVVLEITERTEARLDDLVRAARRLRQLGFRLAADDVGEGNAGLEMLRRLPLDYLKISAQVVAGALTDRGARGVLQAILAFAAEAQVYVIAEGIETQAMLDLVRFAGADGTGARGGQGYLLGRPEVATGPGRGRQRDRHGGDRHGGDRHGGDRHGGNQHDGDQHDGDQHDGDPRDGIQEQPPVRVGAVAATPSRASSDTAAAVTA